MLDLLNTADNVKALLDADWVCLWCGEAEGIALPVVCAPPA